jgi:PmbA protein
MLPDPHLDYLLTLAQQAGANEAEVYYFSSYRQPVIFEANRLKHLQSIESEGIGLRVWQQGRSGLAVAYGSVDPEGLVSRAMAISQIGAEEDPLLANQNPPTWILDPIQISVEQLVAMGEETIDRIRSDYPDLICRGEWGVTQETVQILNTQHLDIQFTDYSLSGAIEGEWVREHDLLEVQSEQAVAPRPNSLQPQFSLEKLVAPLIERLEWAEKTVIVPSGDFPVIFTSQAADGLLETVVASLHGRTHLQKTSPWTEKTGHQIVSSLLSIHQDPMVGVDGLPFDDEGIPCCPVVFIEKGVLKQIYCDQRVANHLHLPLTGNGFRSLGSFPSPGLFNLLVDPGVLSFGEMIKQVEQGLIVDQILGSGGGMSGDFAFNLDLGFWIEGGEIIGRVKDTMVSGNAYEALNRIQGLTQEREWVGSLCTPAFWIEHLSIVSKKDV